jgi:hypothetical protein
MDPKRGYYSLTAGPAEDFGVRRLDCALRVRRLDAEPGGG